MVVCRVCPDPVVNLGTVAPLALLDHLDPEAPLDPMAQPVRTVELAVTAPSDLLVPVDLPDTSGLLAPLDHLVLPDPLAQPVADTRPEVTTSTELTSLP